MYALEAVLLVSVALVMVGIAIIAADSLRNRGGGGRRGGEEGEEKEGGAKVGGVILIGPIPIIIGNDKSLIKWAIVLTAIAVVAFLILAAVSGA